MNPKTSQLNVVSPKSQTEPKVHSLLKEIGEALSNQEDLLATLSANLQCVSEADVPSPALACDGYEGPIVPTQLYGILNKVRDNNDRISSMRNRLTI
jgi:hypothetical protein